MIKMLTYQINDTFDKKPNTILIFAIDNFNYLKIKIKTIL